MIGSLEILVVLFQRQTGQGYFKPGKYFGRLFTSPLFDMPLNIASKTWPNHWCTGLDIYFFDRPEVVWTTIYIYIYIYLGFNLKNSICINYKFFLVLYGDLQEWIWWSAISKCSRGSDVIFWKPNITFKCIQWHVI